MGFGEPSPVFIWGAYNIEIAVLFISLSLRSYHKKGSRRGVTFDYLYKGQMESWGSARWVRKKKEKTSCSASPSARSHVFSGSLWRLQSLSSYVECSFTLVRTRVRLMGSISSVFYLSTLTNKITSDNFILVICMHILSKA